MADGFQRVASQNPDHCRINTTCKKCRSHSYPILSPITYSSFIWDGSESLSIWVGQDNGGGTWVSTEVFLVTNSAAGGSFSIDGGATTFDAWDPGGYQIDGYHRAVGETYYHTSLGDPINNSTDWTVINGFPGLFYETSVDLDASGFLGGQTEWLFAIADFTGIGGIDPDISGGEFSPKTTSAAPVPEPTTLLLLGSGLIGLAGFGRKKLFKK